MMKKVILFSVSVLALLITSCDKAPISDRAPIEQQILGKWLLEGQIIDGKVISEAEQDELEGLPPSQCPYEQYLTFNSDMTTTSTSYSFIELNGEVIKDCTLEEQVAEYSFIDDNTIRIAYPDDESETATLEVSVVGDILIISDPEGIEGTFQLKRQ